MCNANKKYKKLASPEINDGFQKHASCSLRQKVHMHRSTLVSFTLIW
jgi:hypothetical protein